MNLYLDDDLDGNLLIAHLRRRGHDVVSPRDVGTRGAEDARHLRYAAEHERVLLTANAGDFVALHEQWEADGRAHAGILIVYRENNPSRDMSFDDIAAAVTRFEETGIPLGGAYHNLNFWR